MQHFNIIRGFQVLENTYPCKPLEFNIYIYFFLAGGLPLILLFVPGRFLRWVLQASWSEMA